MQACQGLDDLREAAGEVIASTSVEPHLRAGRDRGFHSTYDFLGFALHSRCRHQEQIEEGIKAGRQYPTVNKSRLSTYIHSYPRFLCNDHRLSTAIWRAQR